MSDLIDRQSAIKAIMEEEYPCESDYDEGYMAALDKAVWIIEKWLPSAQPEIIRCKDCKNWDMTWQNDWAKNYHYCPLIDGTRNGDWYCADAERRTDE